jgi:pSer/pThr/pTyr-binding forkhead associated (FHA) protein
MPLRLVCLNGIADIALDRALVVVGRHRWCDARIASPRVSRRHCCLAPDHDGVLVRDLGSTNGTLINGRRVEEGVLRPGDELSIAHYRYQLKESSGGLARAVSSQAGKKATGFGPPGGNRDDSRD